MLLIYAVRPIFVKKMSYCWYCFVLMFGQIQIYHLRVVVALDVVRDAFLCKWNKNDTVNQCQI